MRKAILIINTAHSDDSKFDVNLTAAKHNADQFSKILGSLGDYSFSVDTIIDQKYNDGKIRLSLLLEQYNMDYESLTTDDDSCLLVYYFGHAIDRNNDLHFIFNNSNTDKLPTCLQFSQLARDIFGYGFKNILFILDCCYSGASIKYVPEQLSESSNYAFLCSAIPTNKAYTTKGITPFGVFSTFLFNNLKSPTATKTHKNDITVQTLFDDTKTMLNNKDPFEGPVIEFSQIPKFYDHGLADFILAKNNIKKAIISTANDKAPAKSYYSKYRWIGNQIFSHRSIDIDDLYDIVSTNKPDAFLTPVKKYDVTTYEPVKQSTFYTYVDSMKLLNIIGGDDANLKLTEFGNSMFSDGQSYYNNFLLDLIKQQFSKSGMDIDQLDFLLQRRMAIRKIPVSSELYKDARSIYQMKMNSNWFSILLDLLSYIGYIRITTRKTYYPYY